MRTAGPANPRIRLVWRSRTRMAAIVKPMPATIMILPCTTSPLAQRVLISNMFMGKSEGVASGALAGPFFTLRPQRLGVFRIELCFSKVMVLSPHNKRPQKVPRTRLFSPTPSFQAHRSAQSGTGRTQARHSASRIAFYGTPESAPNFTRVRRSDSSQSRFATVSSSALFGIDAAFGYPFASMKPSGP